MAEGLDEGGGRPSFVACQLVFSTAGRGWALAFVRRARVHGSLACAGPSLALLERAPREPLCESREQPL